jgi:hypothetical protein
MAVKEKKAKEKKTKEKNNAPPLALEVRDAMKPGRGVVFRASPGNIVQGIRYATAMCLETEKVDDKKPPKLELALDKAYVPDGVIGKLESPSGAASRIVACEAGLVAASRMLGTHGGKVPDARLGLGAMVPDAAVESNTASIPGVHSGSVRSTHPLSGAGDARYASHLRFLCMAIAYEGAPPVSLASILAADCPARQALLDGFTDDVRESLLRVGAACAMRLAGGDIPSNVNVYRPQVFFPFSESDDCSGYVALSPVYSYSVGADLAARVQRRSWPEHACCYREIINVRVAHVGGTKAQNGGLLSNYLSGRFPRLVAMPPLELAFEADAIVRDFRRKGLQVAGGYPRKESLEAFDAAWYSCDLMQNVRTAAALRDAISDMCRDVLAAVSVLARENDVALATRGTPIAFAGDLPEASMEVARLLRLPAAPGREALPELDEDEMDAVAVTVARRITNRLDGRPVATTVGREKLSVDERLHDLIAGIARQTIGEYA